ncbi:hypothetical protein ACJJTC_007384 [Scirpophaga incertulas]
MSRWLLIVFCFVSCATGEDFPSLITANASIAIVLDRQFLGDRYQTILDELKDYIKELARVQLKHGGVVVHYFSWTAISLKKGYLAVFSVASCEDTWSLFSRTQEEELLLFALTEVDCPRLPSNEAITVTNVDPGEELPQIILDMRTTSAFKWKSAIILHDDTLSRDMISRVVQSLTLQIDQGITKPVSVSVYKMKHEINEYLRRKEIHRVLSKLPVKYIGENFLAIVTTEVMASLSQIARDLLMSHTLAQWLYVISDTNLHKGNLSAKINALYEGENVAFMYNVTDDSPDCQNGIMCYCREMLSAFVSALDSAVQDEFDVAGQVSDEEWEAIRPSKHQIRNMLLKHMQQYISSKSACGNCSTWRALAADTWGATYRTFEDSEEPARNITSNVTARGVIENIELLQVGYWRPVDAIRYDDVLFPHVEHGFRGKELPVVSYHNPPWTIIQSNESGSIVKYSGLMFDIFHQLAVTKNFTLKVLLPMHVKRLLTSNISTEDMSQDQEREICLAAVSKGQVAIAVAAFTVLSDPPAGNCVLVCATCLI